MSSPATAVRGRAPARSGSRRSTKLHGTVLVQCDPDAAPALLGMLRPGGGLVLTGGTKSQHAQLVGTNNSIPILRDARRYAGKNRKLAGAGVSLSWVDEQWSAGSDVALTDSGYLPPGDHHGLGTLLADAARHVPTHASGRELYVVLALHQEWFRSDLAVLVREVNAHRMPVAIVAEHTGDPFGVLVNVRGFVRFLRLVKVPVLLLRSDLSALGAIGFGAAAGAVGTRTGLRHLYPIKSGGGHSSGIMSAVFEQGLAFVQVDKLAAGVAASPNDPMWLCNCQTCAGRRADWLYGATPIEVAAHNVEVTLDLRDHLMSATTLGNRRQSWRAMCQSAEFQYSAAAAIARVGWSVPQFLNWWQQV